MIEVLIFLTSLKLANVTLVFKKGPTMSKENLRRVSI